MLCIENTTVEYAHHEVALKTHQHIVNKFFRMTKYWN